MSFRVAFWSYFVLETPGQPELASSYSSDLENYQNSQGPAILFYIKNDYRGEIS
jgi:hypothetical protein